jgi:hypothetical protein
MNTLFRLYTEGGPRREHAVRELVGAQFDGFTILQAEGSWKGVRENSIIVEIIGTEVDWIRVESVAKGIKEANAQESVLITRQFVDARFV